MKDFYKPTILVSKCLGFDACRYNGEMAKDDFVEKLRDYAEFITVCPEVGIGLGTPREVIRIVNDGENIRLIQPKTEKDYTDAMFEFSGEFLKNIEEIDGCILKSRSPSCGIKDVKIYNNGNKGVASSKGKGIFGGAVTDKFMDRAVEDEGRLKDFNIREHFLTKVFTLREFREIKQRNNREELNKFHNKNKLLFTMYNKKQLKNLNKIMENKEEKINLAVEEYENYLNLALAKNARYTSKTSILMECYEEFKEKLTPRERDFTLDILEKYIKGHVPYNVPLYLLKSYAVRFERDDMIEQSLFNPYPEELVEMRDSGKVLT